MKRKNDTHKNNSTAQHWQCFSNASVCEGIQRLRVLNAHRLMSHLWINLSLQQEERGKKGGQRSKREKQNTWLLLVQKERGQWLLTIAVATVLCEGGMTGFFDWLEVRVCSVLWKGILEGGRRGSKMEGCKTLRANRNIVSKNFLEGIRGIVGETLATDFPLSGLSFNSAVAVQLNNMEYYILFI